MVMDEINRELAVAEAIVDEILAELDTLCKITDKNGRINNLMDKVLSSFDETVYSKALEKRRENLENVMGGNHTGKGRKRH